MYMYAVMKYDLFTSKTYVRKMNPTRFFVHTHTLPSCVYVAIGVLLWQLCSPGRRRQARPARLLDPGRRPCWRSGLRNEPRASVQAKRDAAHYHETSTCTERMCVIVIHLVYASAMNSLD